MSSLSLLLNFKGHCTSTGWYFQSHKCHTSISDQLNSEECKPAWHDEMSLDDLGPPLYTNIFNKTAVHWQQLLASSCGRPTGWREKKEISAWGQQWVVAQGQVGSSTMGWWMIWQSCCAAALPLSNPPEEKRGKSLCTCYLIATAGSVSDCEICSCTQQHVGKLMMLWLEPWRSPWGSVWAKQPGHGVSVSGPGLGNIFNAISNLK